MIKIWQFIFSLKQLLCGWTHAGTNCCSWYRFVASPSFPSDVFNSWSFAWQDFERSGLWRGPFGHKSFSAWSQQRLQEAGCGLTGQPSGHRSKIPSQWRPHLDGDPILMETPPPRRPHPDGDYIPRRSHLNRDPILIETTSPRRSHLNGDPTHKEIASQWRFHPQGDPISMETPSPNSDRAADLSLQLWHHWARVSGEERVCPGPTAQPSLY